NPAKPDWFKGWQLNVAHNCLDRHLPTRADQPALLYESPALGISQAITYADLTDQVSRFAHVLQERCEVTKGDRVIIYMPMCPEAIVAMLACARLGAIHSVVFGGFASKELATRIDAAQPKAVLSSTHGLDGVKAVNYKKLTDEAHRLCTFKPGIQHSDDHTATANLLRTGDLDWEDCMNTAGHTKPVPIDATDPLYVLYTSGTTGKPKGVVREAGGHAVVLADTIQSIFNIHPGQVMFTPSDIGWVVGHSYIVYAPLLAGATGVLYEGKPTTTPDASAFWRIIEKHKVKAMFTAPTALRAIKKEDPEGMLVQQHDLSSLETVFVAGKRADPASVQWAEQVLQKPIVDNYWQTETGSPMSACSGHLPIKYGSCFKPVHGWDLQIVDDHGQTVPVGETGNLVAKLPLPPGAATTLWKDHERYDSSYLAAFPGYYQTGDAGFIDEDNYVHVLTRTDDVINTAGHRMSTGVLEGALTAHDKVVEAAVVGATDELKGQLPVGFVVLKTGKSFESDHDLKQLRKELVQRVREDVGPVAAFKRVYVVRQLPKTRSGKTLRMVLRQMVDGQPLTLPPTIEDASIVDSVRQEIADQDA
ncbi:uncharacterized protein MONBRDRAFT_13709, partial [Monosiga brevicollis MX1]